MRSYFYVEAFKKPKNNPRSLYYILIVHIRIILTWMAHLKPTSTRHLQTNMLQSIFGLRILYGTKNVLDSTSQTNSCMSKTRLHL